MIPLRHIDIGKLENFVVGEPAFESRISEIDFLQLANLLRCTVTSRYSQRRDAALAMLEKNWCIKDVMVVEEGDLWHIYASPVNRESHMYVQTIDASAPVFEEVPTDEDGKKWASLLAQ